MMEEAEYRCGALYCGRCRRVFYYRTHVLPELEEQCAYKCPDCGQGLREMALNTFMDGTDDVLNAMAQLDEERWDKEFGEIVD